MVKGTSNVDQVPTKTSRTEEKKMLTEKISAEKNFMGRFLTAGKKLDMKTLFPTKSP